MNVYRPRGSLYPTEKLIVWAENSVYVYKKSDFPTVVAGKINLLANTTYFIMASVNIGTDNFVVPSGGNTNLIGAAFNNQSLTYEGSGVMFENSGGIEFLRLDLLSILNTGSGTLMNPTPFVANPLSQVTIFQCLILGFASLGIWTIRQVFEKNAFVDNALGFTFNDIIDFRIDDNIFLNTSDLAMTFVTIGDTGITTGTLDRNTFTVLENETAIDINDGIAATSLIRITNCSIRGAGLALDPTGLDQKAITVLVNSTDGIPDSRTIGSVISQGNDVETAISAIGSGESGYVDLNLGEADGVITAFADNGTGGTTVTSATHLQPNEKLLEITGTTSYNGQHELFAVTANTFDIDVPFVADDATGAWSSGAFAGIDIERWEVEDASNGCLKYIGQPTFDGSYFATLSGRAIGGAARRFKFRLVRSTDGGATFKDGFAIPNEIKATISNTSFIKPVEANTNDLYKMQVANFDTLNNFVADTFSVSIE